MLFRSDASVADILAREDYWGQDLGDMLSVVQEWYDRIQKDGMASAYDAVLAAGN